MGRKAYKSALYGQLKGREMPPFEGYGGVGPGPQETVRDLRDQLAEVKYQLKLANDKVNRLTELVRSLRLSPEAGVR